jgi:hypothetical protein
VTQESRDQIEIVLDEFDEALDALRLVEGNFEDRNEDELADARDLASTARQNYAAMLESLSPDDRAEAERLMQGRLSQIESKLATIENAY